MKPYMTLLAPSLVASALFVQVIQVPRAFASSEGGGRGGADSVPCSKVISKLLDRHPAILADLAEIKNLGEYYTFYNAFSPEDIEAAILNLYRDAANQKPDTSDIPKPSQLLAAIDQLKFEPPQDEELPNIDTGIHVSAASAIFKGCHKVQLATQDLVTGEVRTYGRALKQLSAIEQALYRIHEGYVRVESANFQAMPDIEKAARADVRALYLAGDKHWWGYLPGNGYVLHEAILSQIMPAGRVTLEIAADYVLGLYNSQRPGSNARLVDPMAKAFGERTPLPSANAAKGKKFFSMVSEDLSSSGCVFDPYFSRSTLSMLTLDDYIRDRDAYGFVKFMLNVVCKDHDAADRFVELGGAHPKLQW